MQNSIVDQILRENIFSIWCSSAKDTKNDRRVAIKVFNPVKILNIDGIYYEKFGDII